MSLAGEALVALVSVAEADVDAHLHVLGGQLVADGQVELAEGQLLEVHGFKGRHALRLVGKGLAGATENFRI